MITVESCDKLKNLFSSSIAKQLLQLQEISVTHCSNMKEIVDDEEQGSRNDIVEATELKFGEVLRFLRLEQLPKFRSANGSCKSMQLFNEQVVFPNLEELHLSWINVNTIWHTFITTPCVEKLMKLIIEGCDNLEYIFSSSIARGMVMLGHLEIKQCQKVREVLFMQNVEDNGILIFPQLRFLLIEKLPKLRKFCSGNYIEFPCLSQLTINNCPVLKTFISGSTFGHMTATSEKAKNTCTAPLFDTKVTFPKLQRLIIKFMESLDKIWGNQLDATSFCQLNYVTVNSCKKLLNIFPFSMLERLERLDKLEIWNCDSLEEIFMSQGLGAEVVGYEGSSRLEFTSLKQITVVDCPVLVAFASPFSKEQEKEMMTADHRGSEDRPSIHTQPFFNEEVVFPNLEELQICCMNVNIKWHTSMTTLRVEKLKKLIIHGCDNLEYLFSSSFTKGLMMLGQLEIRECKRMKEIIVTENVEEKENLNLFPQLNFLLIKDLENLIGFYSGNCFIEFPSLEQLQVLNCPKLEGFTVKNFESTNVTTHSLFNEQVAFPNLGWMTISHLKNLEILWHNQLHADSFCRLKSLTVIKCEKLSTVFPSADILVRILSSLEKLSITDCGLLKVVFGIGTFNVKQRHAVIDTKLRELIIHGLPRLKHVWNKDPQEIFSFHNLETMSVSDCQSLKNVFPATVAKNLLQLQKLHLYQCGVEEIVAMEGQRPEAVNFEFPQVSSLKLEELSRFQHFYKGKHTTEWPTLKEFYFSNFSQVKKTSERDQLDFPVQQPHFSAKKVIPQLQILSLTKDDITMICQLKQDLVFNFKVLLIQEYNDKSDVLPMRFLRSCCSLGKLAVKYCNFEELFPPKEDVKEQEKQVEIETLSSIKTLSLECLPYLRHIWSHESSGVLQNLQTLELWKCENLICLSTSTAPFQNLTNLDVYDCKGMIDLISVSTAQSLVQLKSMTVEGCHLLTKIVGNEDETQHLITIVFTQLRYLKLKGLKRLASFCLGNFIFKFPSLEEVIVNQCPKLKNFCEGAVNTPVLRRVNLIEGEDEWRWEGNLNTTIQSMYMEKVGYVGLQELKLSDFPELMEIWHIRNPQEFLDLRQLQMLEIYNCGKIRYLLTPSMVSNLVCLMRLIVKYCETLEQVIMGVGAENQLEFPQLQLISLEFCSNLTSFYVGSHTFEIQALEHILVNDCPKMVTFASTSSEELEEGKSQHFLSNKVKFPNLEFLSLSSINIQQIWHNPISEISSSVQKLKKLIVENCDNLKYLLTSSMLESFAQLNWLEIRDCKMMEWIILTEKLVEDERMCEIFFSKLDCLLLEGLPELARSRS